MFNSKRIDELEERVIKCERELVELNRKLDNKTIYSFEYHRTGYFFEYGTITIQNAITLLMRHLGVRFKKIETEVTLESLPKKEKTK